MEHLFIINPAAGSRDRTEEYCRAVEQTCARHQLSYRIEISRGPGDIRRIAWEAAHSGKEYRIYACGGDGTLNEAAAGAAGCPNAAVTHYVGGSGNDFVKVFSDPGRFRDLEQLLDCEETEFDLIRCNEDLALNICSVGLDARIGTDVARYKRLPLLQGFRAYAFSALVNTILGVSEHSVLELDGQVLDGEHTLICACNGQYYGGGFHPVPDADPRDGLLDVLLVDRVSRARVLSVIGKYKDGHYRDYPQVIHHYKTRSLNIRCDHETPINLDGELRRDRNIQIRIADEKIRFFYPRGLTVRIGKP